MAAIGPAFRAGFNDTAPVSNADIAPTLERILGVNLTSVGKLRGRTLTEALTNGKSVRPWRMDILSKRGDSGLRTIVNMQLSARPATLKPRAFQGAPSD